MQPPTRAYLIRGGFLGDGLNIFESSGDECVHVAFLYVLLVKIEAGSQSALLFIVTIPVDLISLNNRCPLDRSAAHDPTAQ